MPLLVESGQTGYGAVIVVDVDPRSPSPGSSPTGASTRPTPGPGSPTRSSRAALAVADRVIDNSGDLAELDEQVDDLWAWLVARSRRASGRRRRRCTDAPDRPPTLTGLTPNTGTIACPMPPFKVVSDFQPAGHQPQAIAGLAEGIEGGERYQTLLGITGSGKSATIAWTIEQVQRPTLVLAPNKSLAAQLANEFREFFPENRVEYFVSYYDYYQPEAYIASSDTYIEKDSSINDEIDRLRHSPPPARCSPAAT